MRGIIDWSIEWMCHRTDQCARTVRRQNGVRVKRDDVPDSLQRLHVATDKCESGEATVTRQLIELSELATLALPAHPHALGLVPLARAVQQVEYIAVTRVPRVQFLNSFQGLRDDARIILVMLSLRVGEIAQDGKL